MRIPIVDENDEIIGYKEREDRKDQDIVRAAGLWITDKDGNILLAKRSINKKFDPGMWGPVGGVVEEGETYEICAVREAEEEIGLKGVTVEQGPKIKMIDCFACFFMTTIDSNYEFKKQDEEVDQVKWFNKEELSKLLKEKPEIFMNDLKIYLESLKQYEN